jgi:hypothetical protein
MRVLIDALASRGGGGQTTLSNLLQYIARYETDCVEVFVLAPDGFPLPDSAAISQVHARFNLDRHGSLRGPLGICGKVQTGMDCGETGLPNAHAGCRGCSP